jgi:hypothetical protein
MTLSLLNTGYIKSYQIFGKYVFELAHLSSIFFSEKSNDPFEICHDPLLGRDPSVEKHCSKVS